MKKIYTLLLLLFFTALSAGNTIGDSKILACPTASISYSDSAFCTSICSATVTLTGTDAFTGGTFSASPAGLAINTATGEINPCVSAPGTYLVTYTIAAAGGCPSVAATAVVTINSAPVISGTLSACPGSTTQLAGTGTWAASNPWTSSNTAVATVSPTGLVTILASGTSLITYTNDSGCSTSATVTGLPPGGGLMLICNGSTPTSISFDWNNIPGITHNNYEFSINGEPAVAGSQVSPSSITIPTTSCSSITFTLYPIGSVCVPSQTITCSCTMSTDESSMPKLLYNPNPVNDILSIKNDQVIDKVTAFNQLGQIVIQKRFESNEIQLDFSDLKTGLYFITIDSDNKQNTFKIVKN